MRAGNITDYSRQVVPLCEPEENVL